ncbi:MAG: folylpolyglutamate synthase/dihydrofolate synthase family protein [Edaphobacter sp.]
MSYAAAVDHLYALGHELVPAVPSAPRRKFDLVHMRILAAALGQPQATFPAVLIAGTNGKGSTAATLASILTAAGYRTGLYTSPHLIRVNERIQINGVEISDDDFARLYFQVDDTARRLVEAGDLPHPPSFFEVLTALAFLYFAGHGSSAAKPVDIAVLEVGLGGRLDATNIIDPLLSIITDIALDHQDYLGETIAEITREKAGILRPNGILITLPQHPEANQAIGVAAVDLNLIAINAADYIPPAIPGSQASRPAISTEAAGTVSGNHYTIALNGEPLHIDSPLSGRHQQRNLALAIAAAAALRNLDGYNIDENSLIRNHASYAISTSAIETGIRNTRWPGRLELIPSANGPAILLDVAHNPAGAWTLRAAIAQLPETQPRTLLFSCLRDKNLTEMAQILFPLFDSSSDRPHDHIIFAPIDNPRATPVDDLLAASRALDIPAESASDVASALERARVLTPSGGIILATGSIYLVGEISRLAGQG